MDTREKFNKLQKALRTKRGRNIITFLAFLLLSSVMWLVQSLNEESQTDIRCKVLITNVPDSVTRISPIPEAINVSVRARGTQLIKYLSTRTPEISLDYRIYQTANKIQFGETAMRAFFRNMVGPGSQVLSVSPDTLSIAFTNRPGVLLPVTSQLRVSAAPQYVLLSKPKALVDSVMFYTTSGELQKKVKSLQTEHLALSEVKKSATIKIPIQVPANSRAIPDSIPVHFEVEPLISKTRSVPVVPVNVPEGIRLIPVPSQVEVYYMVPMSVYKKESFNPAFVVQADYNDIKDYGDDKMPIKLVNVPKDFSNLFLSNDSVEFIVEQR